LQSIKNLSLSVAGGQGNGEIVIKSIRLGK